MPKQTVEEAAHEWDTTQFGRVTNGVKIELTEEKHSQFLKDAFTAGSTWQKQQGIDWIRCDTELPAPFERTNFGANSLQVLVTDGLNLSNTHYAYSHAGEGIGWFALVFTPTHYALINLPKTDE